MSETLPSLTANGQKLIDRLLTLPQGWSRPHAGSKCARY